MSENLLTKAELAQRLRVTGRTIDRYREEGLPTIPLSSRALRFDWDKVLAWLSDRSAPVSQ